jgi:hypothetical protein
LHRALAVARVGRRALAAARDQRVRADLALERGLIDLVSAALEQAARGVGRFATAWPTLGGLEPARVRPSTAASTAASPVASSTLASEPLLAAQPAEPSPAAARPLHILPPARAGS